MPVALGCYWQVAPPPGMLQRVHRERRQHSADRPVDLLSTFNLTSRTTPSISLEPQYTFNFKLQTSTSTRQRIWLYRLHINAQLPLGTYFVPL